MYIQHNRLRNDQLSNVKDNVKKIAEKPIITYKRHLSHQKRNIIITICLITLLLIGLGIGVYFGLSFQKSNKYPYENYCIFY